MQTIPDFFEQSVKNFSNNIYMLEKNGNSYTGTSYIETRKQVSLLAAGLMAMGLKKGERVALLSEGRNAWVISELAILYCGAVNVPMSVKLAEPEEIRFRISHSGAKMVIVSERQAEKVNGLHMLGFLISWF